MKIIDTGLTEWENQHLTFKEKIKALYVAGNEPALDALEGYKDATKGFQEQLRQAITTNTPFRSLGGAWSFTKVATAKDGIMIDTKPLNTTLVISEESVSADYVGDAKKLLLVQCGNSVWELSKELRLKNLSLKTSGASNGQTIVGAMSTGAHGSAFDFGAIQDFIVGMHLIVSPTRHFWLERKSAPVVSASFIEKLNTALVQNDDLFDAALISFGSFGIIHSVMIETEELFLLETYMRRMPYDDSFKKLMSTLEFDNANLPCGNERPFHFSVMLNPYDLGSGAYVSTFYKRPFRNDYQPPVPNEAGVGPGDDAPCFIGKITNVIPELVPSIVNNLLASALIPFEKQFGTLGEIFSNNTLHGKLFSTAIGIPLSHVNRVTDILFEINNTHGPFPGLFAYRFVKKSKAKLGFTCFDITCVLELDAAPSDITTNFCTAVWNKLEEEQIPFAFHWGKMNELNFDRIMNVYGEDATAWMKARNKLLDADGLMAFTNPLLKEWGLDKKL